MHKAIILLVSERSGSNLLRTLIGNHSEISAPVSPHLISEFYPIRKYYSDLRDDENKKELIKDMLDICNHPYHDWKLQLSANLSSVRSVIKAFDLLYSQKSQQEGKIHYCSKGIHSFEYIDALRSEIPNVKFVHMVRDPRDHVASWLKRPINYFTAFDAIWKWKKEQSQVIDAITSRGLDCISIRYEDLVSNPVEEMTNILKYLDVKVEESCFNTDSKNEESKRNPYWENLSKPIMKENFKKYLKALSEEDIQIIESIAKPEMEFFNYELESDGRWSASPKFHKALEAKRRNARKSSAIEKELPALLDKWRLIREIRQNRKERYLQKGNRISEIERDFSESNNWLIDRLRYISYALFGKSLTSKIARKIR